MSGGERSRAGRGHYHQQKTNHVVVEALSKDLERTDVSGRGGRAITSSKTIPVRESGIPKPPRQPALTKLPKLDRLPRQTPGALTHVRDAAEKRMHPSARWLHAGWAINPRALIGCEVGAGWVGHQSSRFDHLIACLHTLQSPKSLHALHNHLRQTAGTHEKQHSIGGELVRTASNQPNILKSRETASNQEDIFKSTKRLQINQTASNQPNGLKSTKRPQIKKTASNQPNGLKSTRHLRINQTASNQISARPDISVARPHV